jgi:small-conductance mechanosensitive channel
MTGDQSRQLKVGDRVCWNADENDKGTVTAIHIRYITIKWDDGHESFTGLNEMKRVERVVTRKSGKGHHYV